MARDSKSQPGADNVRRSGSESSPRAQVRQTAAAARVAKRRSGWSVALEVVGIVVAAFVIAMLVQAFLFKPFTVHQVSMEPTLVEGDRILINRVTYHFREPARGDVVVFHSPVVAGEDLVKRIVAVGGDTLSIHDGALYLNGERQDEPYLKEPNFQGDYPQTTIPAGMVFVMGDNRNNSADSRLFGPLNTDAILGAAFVVYWPPGHWSGL